MNESSKINKYNSEIKLRSRQFLLYAVYSLFIPFILIGAKLYIAESAMWSDIIGYLIFISSIIPPTLFVYWYLQIKPSYLDSSLISYENPAEQFHRMIIQINEILDAIKLYQQNKNDVLLYSDFIGARLDNLPHQPEFSKFSSRTLEEESRLSLFKLVLLNSKIDLENKLNKELEMQNSKPTEETTKEYSIVRLIKLTEHITSRLKKEIEQLTKRGNIYITIGSIITIAGGVILYMTVKDFIDSYNPANNLSDSINKHDILSITARISVIVFIEIFAYYYLKLYKNIMDNVKFYQNEISNMELKLLALHAIENSGDVESLKTLIEDLAKTERNFVINKGQTTVDIEKAKHESSILYKSIDSISKIIKPSK